MSWWEILSAIRKRWMIFIAAGTLMSLVSLFTYSIGAEYVAYSNIVVTSSTTGRSLLDPGLRRARSVAMIAANDVGYGQYQVERKDTAGRSMVSIDIGSDWPVVHILVRSRTFDDAVRMVEAATSGFVSEVVQAQQDLQISDGDQVRVEVLSIHVPANRPPGSRAALLSMIAAGFIISGALAYSVEQFFIRRTINADLSPDESRVDA